MAGDCGCGRGSKTISCTPLSKCCMNLSSEGLLLEFVVAAALVIPSVVLANNVSVVVDDDVFTVRCVILSSEGLLLETVDATAVVRPSVVLGNDVSIVEV